MITLSKNPFEVLGDSAEPVPTPPEPVQEPYDSEDDCDCECCVNGCSYYRDCGCSIWDVCNICRYDPNRMWTPC